MKKKSHGISSCKYKYHRVILLFFRQSASRSFRFAKIPVKWRGDIRAAKMLPTLPTQSHIVFSTSPVSTGVGCVRRTGANRPRFSTMETRHPAVATRMRQERSVCPRISCPRISRPRISPLLPMGQLLPLNVLCDHVQTITNGGTDCRVGLGVV